MQATKPTFRRESFNSTSKRKQNNSQSTILILLKKIKTMIWTWKTFLTNNCLMLKKSTHSQKPRILYRNYTRKLKMIMTQLRAWTLMILEMTLRIIISSNSNFNSLECKNKRSNNQKLHFLENYFLEKSLSQTINSSNRIWDFNLNSKISIKLISSNKWWHLNLQTFSDSPNSQILTCHYKTQWVDNLNSNCNIAILIAITTWIRMNQINHTSNRNRRRKKEENTDRK